MAYKILYIEDQNPESIMADLTNEGFEMRHHDPKIFEETVTLLNEENFDAILIDFRLTTGTAIFDAPTIAQTARTRSSTTKGIKHTPIFLISTEQNISDYYDDITSNDLFDLSIKKEDLQKEMHKYSIKFKSIIDAYKCIEESKFDLNTILQNKDNIFKLDYRIEEKVSNEHSKTNTYFVSKFIYNQIIRSIGQLIGDDVLAARLGVSKKSDGWEKLKNAFTKSKYTGIFSEAYERWWASSIEEFCSTEFGINSLRRLNGKQRIEVFNNFGFENLAPIENLQFSISTNFWTICSDLKYPIDPIDGLELNKRELCPWQDEEYISILAAFQSSDLLKFVKPMDKERFSDLQKLNQ